MIIYVICEADKMDGKFKGKKGGNAASAMKDKMKGKGFEGRRGDVGMNRGNGDGGDNTENDMERILSDPRFAHVSDDLRLRRVPRQKRSVKLDSRFHALLTDDKFYEKSTMDPRGRKGHYSTKEDPHRLYRFSSEEDSDSDEDSDEDEGRGSGGSESDDEESEEEETINEGSIGGKEDASNVNEDATRTESDKTGETAEAEVMKRVENMNLDYARGEVFFSDDSSDDDSTTTDEDENVPEFEWGELDQDAVWNVDDTEVEETSCFAVCNLDWDRVKAADIMVLLSSFCPRGGKVQRVSIYPSEYGKERMAEEEKLGPRELRETARSNADMDLVDLEKLEKGKLDTDAGASKKDIEALRRYQRNRLRYFYAVVECDTINTARTIYQECDRQPYEGTGILLDLRYIPSDMTFDETPHDVCHKVPEKYDMKTFKTTALIESQPMLTWDETNPERRKALTAAMTRVKKGQELDDECLKGLIASSSEDDGDDVPVGDGVGTDSDSDGDEETKAARIAKFRALLNEIDDKERQKKERDIDLEETFNLADDEGEKDGDDDDSSDDDEEQATQVRKDKAADSLTPFEKYLEKRKSKIKERKHRQKEEKEKKTKGGNTSSEDSDADGELSDDELPDDAGDLYSDPFFAEELKKRNTEKKKKKNVKKMPSKEDEEHNNTGNETKGNLELLLMDEDVDNKKHFSMREIIENSKETKKKRRMKSKIKKKKEQNQQHKQEKITADNFKVNLSDPRFTSLMTSGEYNIDPSHPQFKRTRAMDDLINQVQQKRIAQSFEEIPDSKRRRPEETRSLELSALVKKVKSKTNKPGIRQ
ncbi:hypothetical protein Pmani_037249 [Petrolisthes manimaculis]|uniref:NUC153 domain-containing protein n=1 Tax=Petrolisthes manimaculis TaxID=1843537 RepID=A0AAE1TLP1_9EUCA|nr:hypothetical protein Pmani_037249 [Petrolisthes manimaculis]